MKEKDISNDEIQILGQDRKQYKFGRHKSIKHILLFLFLFLLAVICSFSVFIFKVYEKQVVEDTDEPVSVLLKTTQQEGTVPRGYIEVNEETVNDVSMLIYIPCNVLPELTLELPGEEDSTVIFITQAADIGGNNYGIVGDFKEVLPRLTAQVKKLKGL
jgi:hypothetical protein